MAMPAPGREYRGKIHFLFARWLQRLRVLADDFLGEELVDRLLVWGSRAQPLRPFE